MTVLGIDGIIFNMALIFSKKYGLLSNDALHLAIMKQEGVGTIASNDRDFSSVEWLKIWRP